MHIYVKDTVHVRWHVYIKSCLNFVTRQHSNNLANSRIQNGSIVAQLMTGLVAFSKVDELSKKGRWGNEKSEAVKAGNQAGEMTQ